VPAASLAVLGEGPLRPELERVAHEAGVADRVSFAGARSDARAIVGAADALVITSHWEGLPLVALEGLTAGVPVVATAVRGVAELLTDGVDSVLVAPDHAAAVADGLVRVLTDRHIRSRIVTGGARLAGAHTEEAMTTRYLALYEEIVRPEASAA
jgi:glycosyltransferase involved in cell wall biosynthesis